jgi:hypothetical protein
MDDVHFKHLIDRLRDSGAQIRSERKAVRALQERADRRSRVLQTLQLLCAGPLKSTAKERRKQAFFIGRTVPTALSARMHGARFRKFWIGALIKDEHVRQRAGEEEVLGRPEDCVESLCPVCGDMCAIVGYDPPIEAATHGLTLSCRLFTLCGNCPRLMPLRDAGLCADIEASLEDSAIRALRPRQTSDVVN